MTRTVLVMDKQVVARHMLRFAIELQDCRVVEVADTAGALGVLAGRNPDLLVIGVDAHTDDCSRLIGIVRRRVEPDRLPILLVGENHCRDSWDLRTIGNCAWLDKPFRVGELHGLVESLLGAAPLATQSQATAANEG